MMTSEAVVTRPQTVTETAARVSFAATVLSTVLIALLHVVKSQLDPSWHVLSEYAIGEYGWIMVLAFITGATGLVALFAALKSQLRTVTGRIGLGCLLVTALGMIIAAVFTSDPITVGDAGTTEGALHNVGGTLGGVMPLAAAFVGWNLIRNPAWSEGRRPILVATVAVWLALIVFYVGLGIMLGRSGGEFGPDVSIGWLNRLDMLAVTAWTLTVSWQAIRLRQAR